MTSSILLFAVVLVGIIFFHFATARASFNSNELIDDIVFNNVNTMNVAQINNFLNSFPGSCISPNNAFSAPDPTGYSPSTGFTYGGNVSAGQVIYDASQAYNINPEVILTTLQKEQSLVTGGSSVCGNSHAFSAAMGYDCPDSGACPADPAASGFTQQVIRGAWLLKFGEQRSEGNVNWAVIKGSWDNSDDPSTYYGGPMTQGIFARVQGGTAAAYDGYTTIDGTSVHMNTGGTAALYWYTPHFAGNQNFETIFQSWFGPTTMADSYFAVVCDPNTTTNPGWYLLTATGKYLISGTAYSAWGLANIYAEPGCGSAANTVSQSFFNSLPTGPTLGNLLKDQWGNYFFIDNGQIHYVRSASYLSLWGLNPGAAVQSTGLVYAMPGGDWVGRFMNDPVNGNGAIYLMDGGTKHLVPITSTNLAYQWGYVPDQLTRVSTTYLSSLTDGGSISQFASSGSSNFIIDSGRTLAFPNADVQSAYSAQSYLAIANPVTLSYLPITNATVFVMDTTDGRWYMLEGGKKHYIPNIQVAQDWGYKVGQPLTPISDNFISSLTDGGALTYMVQTTGSQIWAVDGQKHLVPSGAVANAWLGGSSVPTYSTQSLDLLGQGSDLTTLMQPLGSPFVYTLDNGSKRYLPQLIDLDAWGGGSTSIVGLSPSLVNLVPEISPAGFIVQNSGNNYLLMAGTLYPINTSYSSTWNVSSATQIANNTFARFTQSPNSLNDYIEVGGRYYIVNNLQAIPVLNHLDAYEINNDNPVILPENYLPVTSDASYLIGSTDPTNSSMWLINQGQKILFPSFAQEANFGYVSDGVPVTKLDPSVLAGIPNSSSPPSLLIVKPNAGVKQLSFGYALGFPDLNTLSNFTSTTNPVLSVAPSIYDQFTLRRPTSILIRDDSGNIYVMQNGNKDLLQNHNLLNTTYAGIPITYLEGTTIVSIPSGSPIN